MLVLSEKPNIFLQAKHKKVGAPPKEVKWRGQVVLFWPKTRLFCFVPSDEDECLFTYLLCRVVDWEMKHRPQIIHGLDVLYCYLRPILD